MYHSHIQLQTHGHVYTMSRQHRDRLNLKAVMVLANQKGHIHDALGLVTRGLNVLQTTDVKRLVQEETHRRNHRTLAVLSNRTSRYYVWVMEHDKWLGKLLRILFLFLG